MDVVYPVLMFGVGSVILAIMVSEIRAVTARPAWSTVTMLEPALRQVVTVDRRTQNLPFVGVDRRKVASARSEQQAPLKLAA